MTAFSYRAYLASGAIESGVVQALDQREASRKLSQENKRPFLLKPLADEAQSLGQASLGQPWWKLHRAPDIAKLLTDLSVLLQAGFSAATALRVLASAEASVSDRTRLERVSDEITTGRSLAQAFAALPGVTPEVSATIAAGEASGTIAEVVARMGDIHSERARRRAAIRDALIYPAFLLLMVVAAFFFLALFLMPAIEPVFASGTVEKPFVVTILSASGTLIRGHGAALAALGAVATMIAALLLARPSGKVWLSRLVLVLPVVGSLRRQAVLVRFLDTLSLLSGSNVALIEALRLAADTCSLPTIRTRLQEIGERVANGEHLQPAFRATGLFDAPTLTLIGIGEESNSLSPLFKRASALIEARLKTTLDRMIVFLTPAITIGLGLLIGTLVVSVMTALLSMNEIAIQ